MESVAPSLSLVLSSFRENGEEAFEKQAYFGLEEEQAVRICGLAQGSLQHAPRPPQGLLYCFQQAESLFNIKFEKLNLFN